MAILDRKLPVPGRFVRWVVFRFCADRAVSKRRLPKRTNRASWRSARALASHDWLFLAGIRPRALVPLLQIVPALPLGEPDVYRLLVAHVFYPRFPGLCLWVGAWRHARNGFPKITG